MTSQPLDSTHGQTTSGVACNHRLWAAHTVERHRAWHAILALGRQTPSNDVKRGMPSSPLGSTNGQTMLGRGMPSPPLGSTNGQRTSRVACHNRLWAAHTVERRWVWHDITAFGQHTRLNDVGRDMPTPPLDSPHGRTTSSMAFH